MIFIDTHTSDSLTLSNIYIECLQFYSLQKHRKKIFLINKNNNCHLDKISLKLSLLLFYHLNKKSFISAIFNGTLNCHSLDFPFTYVSFVVGSLVMMMSEWCCWVRVLRTTVDWDDPLRERGQSGTGAGNTAASSHCC